MHVCHTVPIPLIVDTYKCATFRTSTSQTEQEMGLVVCKQDVKSKFLSKWKLYVKAILQYAEKSRKKNIANKLAHLDEEGKKSIKTKMY